MGGERLLGVTWWGSSCFCQRLRLAQVLLWDLCPWSLMVSTLPFPHHCRAPALWAQGSGPWHGSGHFCSKLARGIFGSSSALQAARAGSGLSRPLCCPTRVLGLAGLSWQARLFGAGVSAQQRTSVCPAPVWGWIQKLGSADGQLFSLLSCLFSACHARPSSAALQAEAAVIFRHVLHRGVVGPTRQLRSPFHVFTCLGKAHPCFVGSLLGCTNSVRQNHEQVLVQPW